MKIERVGPPVMYDGQRVGPGDIVDVDATVAESLLGQGTQDDGTEVAPMWRKPARKTTAKPKEGEE